MSIRDKALSAEIKTEEVYIVGLDEKVLFKAINAGEYGRVLASPNAKAFGGMMASAMMIQISAHELDGTRAFEKADIDSLLAMEAPLFEELLTPVLRLAGRLTTSKEDIVKN